MQVGNFLCVLCFVTAIYAQQVEMEISNLRNLTGCIRIGIFDNEKSFKEEKPIKELVFKKTGINNGKLVVRFGWKEGLYGFAILDDENEDGKMNYNFCGIPKEGYGFSNYQHNGFTKPSFSDFAINIKPGINKVRVSIQYVF